MGSVAGDPGRRVGAAGVRRGRDGGGASGKQAPARTGLPGQPADLPPCRPAQGYHEYINENLPPESPYLYGLHPNAEIGFLTVTSEKLFRTVLEMQPKETDSGAGTGVSREEKVGARGSAPERGATESTPTGRGPRDRSASTLRPQNPRLRGGCRLEGPGSPCPPLPANPGHSSGLSGDAPHTLGAHRWWLWAAPGAPRAALRPSGRLLCPPLAGPPRRGSPSALRNQRH